MGGDDFLRADVDDGFFFQARFDFFLYELEFDAFWIIIRDEFGIPELIDERFAASCKIVQVEDMARFPRNAHDSASAAFFFSLRRWLQCFPRSWLRDGVR